MAKITWIYPLRAIQATLSIVILGLMAYGTFPFFPPYPSSLPPPHTTVILLLYGSANASLAVSSWWSTHWRQSSPSEINYLIFAPAWSLLSLIPLLLVPLKFSHLVDGSKGVRWALVGAEGLVVLFWFSGFVALAVFLSGRICFGMVCQPLLHLFCLMVLFGGRGAFGDYCACGSCQISRS
jgi:hypothetical protein